MAGFDTELLQRWERLSPGEIYAEARQVLYRQGASTSEEFLEGFEDLVERGLLTWDDIERVERS